MADLTATEFQDVFGIHPMSEDEDWYPQSLVIDGTIFHHTETRSIPKSIAEGEYPSLTR